MSGKAAAAREAEEEPLLPRAGRSSLQPRATGAGPLSWLEDAVAFTADEVEAHQRLMDLAAVQFDRDSAAHEAALRSYWELMLDGEYEAKSRRWRELGFQADDPRTDFRGGGLIALRCLCFLAERHRDEARRWAAEAREGHGELLFSAACINVCALLLVHLELNAQSVVSPVPGARPACNSGLKRFVRGLPSRESEFEAFGELFVAAVRKLREDWRAFCARRPDANLMHFGEVLQGVSVSLDCALCCSKDPQEALKTVNPAARLTGVRRWLARVHSALLLTLLEVTRCCCCVGRGVSA